MLAESNIVRPASRQTSTSRVASATSLAPQALKNSLPPPKVPVPRLSTGTLKPEPSSCLYSIRSLLLEVGERQGGDRVVRRSIPSCLFRCSTNREHCSFEDVGQLGAERRPGALGHRPLVQAEFVMGGGERFPPGVLPPGVRGRRGVRDRGERESLPGGRASSRPRPPPGSTTPT